MAYRMARLPITLSEAEGHFCCLNLCNTHNSGNIASLLSVFTYKLESTRGFLPRDVLLVQCKARSCYRMSSVRPCVRRSVRLSVTLVDHFDLLFAQIRVHNHQPKLPSLLSQERLRLRISNFLCTFKNFQDTHIIIRRIARSSLQQHSFLV